MKRINLKSWQRKAPPIQKWNASTSRVDKERLIRYCLIINNNKSDPKMSRKHLNIEPRNLLYQLSQEGNLSQRQMAVWLGCHQSTISRELRRNQSSLGCYLPDTAQAESETRRKNAKQPFKNVSESALELVKKGLKDYHSPEQIAGRLKRASQESLSHETIYQMNDRS